MSDLNPPQLRALRELCSELAEFDSYVQLESNVLSEFLGESSRALEDYHEKAAGLYIVLEVLKPAHALDTFLANPGFVDDVQRFIDELRPVQSFVRSRQEHLPKFAAIPLDEYERRLWTTADELVSFGPVHLTMQNYLVTVFDKFWLPGYPADDSHAAAMARKRFEKERFPPVLAARDRFFEDHSVEHLESFVAVAEELLYSANPVRELTAPNGPLVRDQELTTRAEELLNQLSVAFLTEPLLAE